MILLLGILASIPTSVSAGTPKNFDVAVGRDDFYILKNGQRWNWQNEDYAKFMEDWWSQFWRKPQIFSFRDGRVLMKRENRISNLYNNNDFQSWYEYKEVIEGTFKNGSFKGASTTYMELYSKWSNQKYSYPSGLMYRSWYGGKVEGEVNRDGILVLKQYFAWDRGLHRSLEQIKDSKGDFNGYRWGEWKQIPHYENSDTYVGVANLKLPSGFYNEPLQEQPDFSIANPNKELEGAPIDESAATTGGPGGAAPAADPASQSGGNATKPNAKIQTGDVVFASGSHNITTGKQTTNRQSSNKKKSATPKKEEQKEKTQKAAKAAGAAAAGTAAAAAGAAAMMGAAGFKKEDVLDSVKELTGKKKATDGKSPEKPETELDPYEAWEKKYTKMGWEYDDERGGFVPKKGAVNDKGEVWTEDPYEPGSVKFVPKEDIDFYNKQKAAGMVYNEHGGMAGWHTQDEINQHNQHEDLVNSDEFKADQEAKLKKQDQDKADSDPEYQAGLKVTAKYKEMEKDFIKEDMERETKSAGKWNERADKMGNIANGLNTVKKGSDLAISGLATITPGGSLLKTTYNALSNAGGSYATDGDIVNALKEGTISVAKDTAGNVIGSQIKLPGGDIVVMKGKTVTEVAKVLAKDGGKEVLKISAEVYKGDVIDSVVNEATDEITEAVEDTQDDMFGDSEEEDSYTSDDNEYDSDDDPGAYNPDLDSSGDSSADTQDTYNPGKVDSSGSSDNNSSSSDNRSDKYPDSDDETSSPADTNSDDSDSDSSYNNSSDDEKDEDSSWSDEEEDDSWSDDEEESGGADDDSNDDDWDKGSDEW